MVSLLILVNIALFFFVSAGLKSLKNIQLIALGSEVYQAIPQIALEDYKELCVGPAPFAAEAKTEWKKKSTAFHEKWAALDVAGRREMISEHLSPVTVANRLCDTEAHLVLTVIFLILWLIAEVIFAGGFLASLVI